MNAYILEEVMNTRYKFTVHLSGHTDPITIEKDRHKPVLDKKRKTLTIKIPDYLCTRVFIIDIDSITHLEYYVY